MIIEGFQEFSYFFDAVKSDFLVVLLGSSAEISFWFSYQGQLDSVMGLNVNLVTGYVPV